MKRGDGLSSFSSSLAELHDTMLKGGPCKIRPE